MIAALPPQPPAVVQFLEVVKFYDHLLGEEYSTTAVITKGETIDYDGTEVPEVGCSVTWTRYEQDPVTGITASYAESYEGSCGQSEAIAPQFPGSVLTFYLP